jgi:predicted phosphodiesterase
LIKRGFDPKNKQKYHCENCGAYPTEGAKRHRDKKDIIPIPTKKKKSSQETYKDIEAITKKVIDSLEPKNRLEPVIEKGTLKKEKWVQEFSDLHYGLEVNPIEIGDLGYYNTTIAKERVNYLAGTMAKILEYYPNRPEELYLMLLGDNMEGAYMRGNQQANIEFGVSRQIIELEELITDYIIYLSKYFPVIKIFAVVGGNHGRPTANKKDSSPSDNLEQIIYSNIKYRLKDIHNIFFEYSIAKHMIVEISGMKFWLEHGDTSNSWLGIPYYGLQREMMNINKMLAIFKEHADFLLCGHFHSKAVFESVIMNGSFVGGDIHSVGDLRRMDLPSQKVFGVNEKHGIVWDRNIFLIDDPRKLKVKIYK